MQVDEWASAWGFALGVSMMWMTLVQARHLQRKIQRKCIVNSLVEHLYLSVGPQQNSPYHVPALSIMPCPQYNFYTVPKMVQYPECFCFVLFCCVVFLRKVDHFDQVLKTLQWLLWKKQSSKSSFESIRPSYVVPGYLSNLIFYHFLHSSHAVTLLFF